MYICELSYRDCIIRDDWHDGADIDVNVLDEDLKTAVTNFESWAADLGLTLAKENQGPNNVLVTVKVPSANMREFSLDFVNCSFYTKRSLGKGRKIVDLDVNNLQLSKVGITKKVDCEGPSVDAIISRCKKGRYKLILPKRLIAVRVQKFEQRGWRSE